jgi:hypothetical protein
MSRLEKRGEGGWGKWKESVWGGEEAGGVE